MFGLVAIWLIALIDRLRFLFFSPLFLVCTFSKADFCLSPLVLLLPPPPTSPSSAVPIELLQWKIYFYLDTQHEMKTQTSDRHCAVRAREGWVKKLCSLVITIRILGVILSDFYLLEIANQCPINKKVLSSKAFLLVKNQTLNKTLLQKIHRSTKNIHTSFFYATTYYTPNSLYKNKRPLELYIYNYDSLFHYLKTCFIFLS